MAAPKLKLTYFDGPGRGEAIRLAFVVGDVEFEDVRLSGPQFSEQKAAGRFKNGVVPVLEIDGVQYAQSLALLLYAGKLAEIYPTDPTAALAVDEVLLSCDDIQTIVFGVVYQRDKATKEAAAKAAIAGPLTAWLNRFDAALAKNSSGYFVGDSITIADLKVLVPSRESRLLFLSYLWLLVRRRLFFSRIWMLLISLAWVTTFWPLGLTSTRM
eukprot:m.193153 g.193153  ORF g.193153 m.193153 type:complete len:213 (-) comp53680_c0_seq3:878-1516(-)